MGLCPHSDLPLYFHTPLGLFHIHLLLLLLQRKNQPPPHLQTVMCLCAINTFHILPVSFSLLSLPLYLYQSPYIMLNSIYGILYFYIFYIYSGLVGVLIYTEVSLNRNVKSFITNGQDAVNELSIVSASVS